MFAILDACEPVGVIWERSIRSNLRLSPDYAIRKLPNYFRLADHPELS
jgi:hypothetical protein